MGIEQIAKDCTALKEGIELKGKEIAANLFRLYDMLNGLNVSIFQQTKAEDKWGIQENKEGLFILTGNNGYAGNIFSIFIDKKRKIFMGTGDADVRNGRKYFAEPILPEGRILPPNSKDLLQYSKKRYMPSDKFFSGLASLYPNYASRINEVITKIEKFPEKLELYAKELKSKALELHHGSMEERINALRDNYFLSDKEILLFLYQTKPEVFKVYFESFGRQEKIKLCKDLLHLTANPLLDNWLSKKYADIVTEAGRELVLE